MLPLPTRQHSSRPTIPWLFFPCRLENNNHPSQHLGSIIPTGHLLWAPRPTHRSSVWEPPTRKAPADTRWLLPALGDLRLHWKQAHQPQHLSFEKMGYVRSMMKNRRKVSCQAADWMESQEQSTGFLGTSSELSVELQPLNWVYSQRRDHKKLSPGTQILQAYAEIYV